MNNNNKYVFIIDNSMIIANRIFNALSYIKCILKIDYAANGKEALEKIFNNPPNIILLDSDIRDMVGIDIIKQIKQVYPNMAIIVLTDYPTNYSFNEFKKLGADGYYNKSNELDMAIQHLENLVK